LSAVLVAEEVEG